MDIYDILPALLALKIPGNNAEGISFGSTLNFVFVQSILPKSPIPSLASVQMFKTFNAYKIG